MIYLTDMPQEISGYGFCKVLAVRYEMIHIKHIFTELFVRKTIPIEKYLDTIGMFLFDYMEYMTNRMRHVFNFSREYETNINDVVKNERDHFFLTLELYTGLKYCIVLDFDGVVTDKNFKKLYELCITRCNTVYICTANPTITEQWFINHGYSIPSKIYACKGKQQKIKKLLDIHNRFDYLFYIDNEKEYLEYAWIFGIQTYLWIKNKIEHFSMCTK